ncbi:MAG TPA: ATP-binding cassette domain-containing protein [Terriglobia bacterium]|nr:ATP-binding cassette domain-containing protein [Terriglobia bacterium]
MMIVPAQAGGKTGVSGAAAPLLNVRAVSKTFGAVTVLRQISLEVAPAEFLTILGASGSGKTTLLRLIAGFERPDEGEIWMGGVHLDPLPPYRRRVNTVFQHYALFPHLTVFENAAYGLRVRKVARAEIPERVRDALAMVKMSDFAARRPAQLSGGQQQRVALARALVNRPALLLLDEPLSALDAGLRREMQLELKSLQREVGISFVFVTHDQEEAMALSDRIALLRAGTLEQVAAPREIYHRPATAYAAGFIGQTNLLRGRVESGLAQCGALTWRVSGAPVDSATFSLRPENIRLLHPVASALSATAKDERAGNGEAVLFAGAVRRQVFGGATDLLEIECPDGRVLLARIPSRGEIEGSWAFEFNAADAARLNDEA